MLLKLSYGLDFLYIIYYDRNISHTNSAVADRYIFWKILKLLAVMFLYVNLVTRPQLYMQSKKY